MTPEPVNPGWAQIRGPAWPMAQPRHGGNGHHEPAAPAIEHQLAEAMAGHEMTEPEAPASVLVILLKCSGTRSRKALLNKTLGSYNDDYRGNVRRIITGTLDECVRRGVIPRHTLSGIELAARIVTAEQYEQQNKGLVCVSDDTGPPEPLTNVVSTAEPAVVDPPPGPGRHRVPKPVNNAAGVVSRTPGGPLDLLRGARG